MILNDKIKALLGEELSAQLEAIAPDTELAIMNDGSVVKAEKHETLKAEHKTLEDKYQTNVTDATKKLDAALTSAADYDTLKKSLDDIKAENIKLAEAHKTETEAIRKMAKAKVDLLADNLDPKYLDIAISQLNMDQLSFDGENLIGLADAKTKIKESFPEFFGKTARIGATPGDGVGTNVVPPGTRESLIEQYNAAEAKGDAKAMGAIQTQIKQLPKEG